MPPSRGSLIHIDLRGVRHMLNPFARRPSTGHYEVRQRPVGPRAPKEPRGPRKFARTHGLMAAPAVHDGFEFEAGPLRLSGAVPMAAMASGQKRFAGPLGLSLNVPLLLDTDDGRLGLGNVEAGGFLRFDALAHRVAFFATVALPTSTFDDDGITGGLSSRAHVTRTFGDTMRVGAVVPGITTFRMALSLQAGDTVYYRVVADLGLIAGAGDSVVMGRFDGEIGARIGRLTISAASVTRVGEVLRTLSETSKNALQAVGGTVAVSIGPHYQPTHLEIYAESAMPLLSFGDRAPSLVVGVRSWPSW